MKKLIVSSLLALFSFMAFSQDIVDLIKKLPDNVIIKNQDLCQKAIKSYFNGKDHETRKITFENGGLDIEFSFDTIDLKNGYAEFQLYYIGGQKEISGSLTFWNKSDDTRLIGLVMIESGAWPYYVYDIDFYNYYNESGKLEKLKLEEILPDFNDLKTRFKNMIIEACKNDKDKISSIDNEFEILYSIELPQIGKDIRVNISEVDCEDPVLQVVNAFIDKKSNTSVSYVWSKDKFTLQKQ